ncbi:hypothetical protein R84B8_02600 [Treponema sp. R8-4-B8]
MDIYSLGIKPIASSTACWRGFVATYAINRGNLVLKKLYTNNGKGNDIPLINNKSPERATQKVLADCYKNTLVDFTYKNVNLFIPYTGSILITRNFIRERYVHMGFQSPFSYEIVIQLTFKDGKFISSKDLSDIAKSVREKKIKLPERNDDEDYTISMMNWVNDCFDISFDIKVNELLNDNK